MSWCYEAIHCSDCPEPDCFVHKGIKEAKDIMSISMRAAHARWRAEIGGPQPEPQPEPMKSIAVGMIKHDVLGAVNI